MANEYRREIARLGDKVVERCGVTSTIRALCPFVISKLADFLAGMARVAIALSPPQSDKSMGMVAMCDLNHRIRERPMIIVQKTTLSEIIASADRKIGPALAGVGLRCRVIKSISHARSISPADILSMRVGHEVIIVPYTHARTRTLELVLDRIRRSVGPDVDTKPTIIFDEVDRVFSPQGAEQASSVERVCRTVIACADKVFLLSATHMQTLAFLKHTRVPTSDVEVISADWNRLNAMGYVGPEIFRATDHIPADIVCPTQLESHPCFVDFMDALSPRHRNGGYVSC